MTIEVIFVENEDEVLKCINHFSGFTYYSELPRGFMANIAGVRRMCWMAGDYYVTIRQEGDK